MAKRQVFSALNLTRMHGELVKSETWGKLMTVQRFQIMTGKK